MPDPGDEYFCFLTGSGCDPLVIAHCRAVRDVAVRIADRIMGSGSAPVHRDLVAAGAVLHDIGRSETHGMGHADAGGRICREKGLQEPLCRIVERHIGAGLTGRERAELGLPDEDRIPESLEEKIVAHADNLVKGTRVITRCELERSIGKFPEDVRKRFISLADELENLARSPLP
jgi:uncharacterized protein